MPKRKRQTLVETVAHDPRLRVAPPLAQLTWLRLTAAMEKMRVATLPGVAKPLRRAEIMTAAGLTEDALAAELPALLRYGLLRERCAPALLAAGLVTKEEDGALAVPDLTLAKSQPASDRRAAAARENGRKGGRPRKLPDPAQREIMLPIEGGATAAEPAETQVPGSASWVSLGGVDKGAHAMGLR